jgi:hypothetical protein
LKNLPKKWLLVKIGVWPLKIKYSISHWGIVYEILY